MEYSERNAGSDARTAPGQIPITVRIYLTFRLLG